MIVLLDSKESDFEHASEDFGGLDVGQLLTPLTRRSDFGLVYGIDNGAFARFDPAAFLSLLDRQHANMTRCKFVAAPDVVGSARRTLEVFDEWYPRLKEWPVALVAQDGIEDLPIQWDLIAAVFIGGSTRFKESMDAVAVAKAAQIMGKWVHVGRVNTKERFDRWADIGADSIDGTGISRYTHMRLAMVEPGLPIIGGNQPREEE